MTERIGEIECSVWRGSDTRDPYAKAFGLSFLAALLVAFGLLAAWAKGITWALTSGNFVLAKVFACSLFVVLYGAMLVPIVLRKRHRATAKTPDPIRPANVPHYALPMIVSIMGDSRRGLTQGWFWFDGPWAVFEGERFDFRMASRDLHMGKKPVLVGAERRRLVLSKGLPLTAVFLRVGCIENELFARIDYDKAQLASWVDAWAKASPPRERSLLPPLRYPPDAQPSLPWGRLALVGCFLGVAVFAFLSLLPQVPRDRVLGASIAIGAFIPAMIAFSWFGDSMTRRSNEGVIEKFISKNPR